MIEKVTEQTIGGTQIDSLKPLGTWQRGSKAFKPLLTSRSRIRRRLYDFLEHWGVILSTTIITVFVLFADDMRQLTADPSTDFIYYIAILACFGVFTVEIILSSIAKPNYIFSFYFWLDIISTLTLLLDVGWVSDAIFGTSGSTTTALSSATIARAARASKIGSRAGRIVRILRLIRLIRIVKLYKATEQIKLNDKKTVIKKELKGDFESHMVNNSHTSLNKERSDAYEIQIPREIATSDRRSFNQKYNRNELFASDRGALKRKLTKNSRVYQSNAQSYNAARMNSKFSLIDVLEDNNLAEQTELAEALKLNNIMEKSEIEIGPTRSDKGEVEREMMDKETNVGKKLSDLTTKRVVIIVLIIMFCTSIFNASTYIDQYSNYTYGVRTMYRVFRATEQITGDFNEVWDYYIAMTERNKAKLCSLRLIKFRTGSESEVVKSYGSMDGIKSLRDTEMIVMTVPEVLKDGSYYIIAYFDDKFDQNISAVLSMLRTLFVCVVMAGAALLFSKDATDLVLTPIENMMRKINNITENPLNAAKIEEEEAFLWGKMLQDHKSVAKEKEEQDHYETAVLEKIIVKIGGLLALGFGEAGSEIIVQNMKGKGEIDPLIPGSKIMAVFGFCDIRNFTDATEVLQEEVMVFVNEIAEVIHSHVDKFGGNPNKNIGDAFLLVWKFHHSNVIRHENGDLDLDGSLKVTALVDMAVFSFVKIMADLYQNKGLDKYRRNPKLIQRIPGFRVRMGLGLNLGWAIEGAIGSEFKIDASYLSPHVNIASRLEAATKQFGVPILISDKVKNSCSKEVRNLLRKIDCVKVKGSDEPLGIYTFDADCDTLKIFTKEPPKYQGLEKKKYKFIQRNKKKNFHEKIFNGKIKTIDIFKKSPDVVLMHSKYNEGFYDRWKKGFKAYIQGDWKTARGYMEQTEHYIKGVADGPSRALLNVMSETDFNPPVGWTGVRNLTEK